MRVKITKSKLKELVRQSIFETIPQKKDKKEAPPQQKGGNDDTAEKLKIKIPDNPFDGADQNKLRELIRKKIKELKFKNKAEFDAYNKKHKMRKGTKVSVGGKDTTAGDIKKKDLPFDPDPPKKEPDMDAGGPSYANVPKGAKTSAQARGMKKAQDLAKSAIPKQKDIKDMSSAEKQKYFSKVTTDLSAVKGPKPGGDWTVKGVQNAKIGDNSVGDILAMGFNHKDYKAAYDYTQQFQGDPPKKKSDTEKDMMGASKKANKKMDGFIG